MTQVDSPLRLFRLAVFLCGSLSIGSLLLYFFGVASFARLATGLLLVEGAGLVALGWLAWHRNGREAQFLLWSGLCAGCLATLAYDIVRIPLVHSGVPIFKAISYFGTALLGLERPTGASELLGWAYHLSNGVSFGLMYAALVTRPSAVTAGVLNVSGV